MKIMVVVVVELAVVNMIIFIIIIYLNSSLPLITSHDRYF